MKFFARFIRDIRQILQAKRKLDFDDMLLYCYELF